MSGKMTGLLLTVVLMAVLPRPTVAIPKYTLLTGNKCINCHVNAAGGGQRNELGTYSNNDVALLRADALGMEGLYESLDEGRTLFDNRLLIGLDARVQMARSHSDEDAERRVFPMQAALYAAFQATNWLQVEGTYNGGPKVFDGQEKWAASALFQPSFRYPQLRVGFFQPSIGMRYADHTMFTRSIARTEYTPFIAPNYAEYGAELNYDGVKWLTLTAGVYSAKNLAENSVTNADGSPISIIEDEDNLSTLGRIVVWPRANEGQINTYAGVSALVNGDLSLINIFGGIGLTDIATLHFEFASSDKEGLRKTNNLTLELGYLWSDPLLLYVRGERGSTETTFAEEPIEATVYQVVLGAKLVVIPYVELRPEYRLLDTELEPRTVPQFRSTRYALQLHIFY